MGKYLRKAETTAEDLGHHHLSALGVRTRARTLALKKQQHRHSPADSTSFLQLRTRRLPKLPSFFTPASTDGESTWEESTTSRKPCSFQSNASEGKSPNFKDGDAQEEASLGENVGDVESGERNVREITPCSSMVKSEIMLTPGSTTQSSGYRLINKRMHIMDNQTIPSSAEMDKFFGEEEQLQLQQFRERYNYDPINDCPISGRYDWVKLD